MKRETLIKVIDEEFGDMFTMSWLIDTYLKAFKKNDSRIDKATIDYINQAKLVEDTLTELIYKLKEMEKAELENGVRILHKRKKVDS